MEREEAANQRNVQHASPYTGHDREDSDGKTEYEQNERPKPPWLGCCSGCHNLFGSECDIWPHQNHHNKPREQKDQKSQTVV
jgi:hypothetical protein